MYYISSFKRVKKNRAFGPFSFSVCLCQPIPEADRELRMHEFPSLSPAGSLLGNVHRGDVKQGKI